MFHTVCPRSSDPFHIVSYYIKWDNYFLDKQYTASGYMTETEKDTEPGIETDTDKMTKVAESEKET